MTNLRKHSLAIQRGSYISRWVNEDILVFERQQGDDVVTVALNRGPSTSITVRNLALSDGSYTNLLDDNSVYVTAGQATLHLAKNQSIVLHEQGNSNGDPLSRDITFTCYNGVTTQGQSVYAVGNHPKLSNWTLGNAIKLEPSQYPIWSSTVTLPAKQNIEWKCVKRNESDPTENVVWQSGANNQFNTNEQNTTQGSF